MPGTPGKIKSLPRVVPNENNYYIHIWDISSGQELRRLVGHTDSVFSVAWDTQGKHLASGSRDKTVRVWEIVTGQEIYQLNGHKEQVNSVAWDAKGERLASGSSDGTIMIWDVKVHGEKLRQLPVIPKQ